jgi:hypothetical protein
MACLRDTGIGVLDASGARLTPATDMAAFAPFIDIATEMGARHVLATGDDPDATRRAWSPVWPNSARVRHDSS